MPWTPWIPPAEMALILLWFLKPFIKRESGLHYQAWVAMSYLSGTLYSKIIFVYSINNGSGKHQLLYGIDSLDCWSREKEKTGCASFCVCLRPPLKMLIPCCVSCFLHRILLN